MKIKAKVVFQIIFKYPFILCLALGCLTALCFAPLNWWILLFLIIPLFYKTVEIEQSFRSLCFKFCLFGYGYFFTNLYWISFAMRYQAGDNLAYGLLTLFGLPFLLCGFFLIIGIVFYVIKITLPKFIWPGMFILSWIWGEMVRSFLFTGFPWNLVGYAFGADSFFAPLASVIGLYGLGVIILLMSFVGYYIYKIYKGHKLYYTYIAGLALVMVGCFFLIQYKPDYKSVKSNLALTIAQPSIDQARKMDFKASYGVLNDYINFSKKAELDSTKTNILLWPETAIRYDLFNETFLRKEMMSELHQYDYLITGLVRVEAEKAYNSLIVIDKKGDVISYYDKMHLVPFGEYMPFQEYIKLLTFGTGHYGFSEGVKPDPLQIGNAGFLPLICYEAIFSNEILNRVKGVDFILNISNDGWYGNTSGPFQHLDMVRFRAIETGKPVIRSANTGVSAFIDAKGHIIDMLTLNESGVLTLDLTFMNHSGTLYLNGFNLGIEKLFFNSFMIVVFFLFLVALRRIYVSKYK